VVGDRFVYVLTTGTTNLCYYNTMIASFASQSLYIKRGKAFVRNVPTSVTVGVASSVANDATMRMTHMCENGGCELPGRQTRE